MVDDSFAFNTNTLGCALHGEGMRKKTASEKTILLHRRRRRALSTHQASSFQASSIQLVFPEKILHRNCFTLQGTYFPLFSNL